MQLTEEQQYVMDNIIQNSHGLHILTGTPGSGKMFFVKYIAQYFQNHNKKVIISATTGAAALRLCKTASTVHTMFRIPTHGYLSVLHEPSLILTTLKNADVIIIDEISMMTSNMLCAVEERIKQSTRSRDIYSTPNKLIILIGDLAQLPAICIHKPKLPDIICKACHITSAPSWALAKQHKLRTSVRHSSDPSYLNFLNIIRQRPPTEAEIEDTLGTCFIDNDMLSNYLNPTTTILCSHREDVTMYNDCIFKSIFAPKDIIPITLDTNATEAHNVSEWLKDSKFDQLHHVAVGALVMFTSNVNVAKGAVNGATTTVTSVHLDTHGVVTTIGVHIIGTATNIYLKRYNFKHKYTYEQYYYKASFPIVLAYAMTGHKSQGATISNNVVVDIRNAFAPGLTYVMLSRTTNRKHLKIVRKLVPSDFIPCPLLDTT